MTDTKKLAAFDAVLAEALGGSEVLQMLVDYHVDNYTIREIADRHDETKSTVHYKIVKARIKLRRLGLMPVEWEQNPFIQVA